MACFFFIEMVQAQNFLYCVALRILSTIDRDRVNLACPETLDEVLRDFRMGGRFLLSLPVRLQGLRSF